MFHVFISDYNVVYLVSDGISSGSAISVVVFGLSAACHVTVCAILCLKQVFDSLRLCLAHISRRYSPFLFNNPRPCFHCKT